MEESSHPLGMTVLEVQDTVAGYESLNQEIIQRLMATEDFSTLLPSMQRRVLGQMVPISSWLVAEVGGAVILVTNQWVVSIHGDSPVHCVEALIKYRNAIASELAATVIGELRTPVVENTGPLNELVIRRERRRRFRGYMNRAAWMLAGAVAGMAITMIGSVLVGG